MNRSSKLLPRLPSASVTSSRGASANDGTASSSAEPSVEMVDEAAEQTDSGGVLSSKQVWLASFVALGTADFGSLTQLTSTSLAVLDGLGAVGGAGLIATSAGGLKKGSSDEEKLDAANNIAWGGQGLMYLAPSTLGAWEVALGLGLVGSAMQTAVGVMRVRRGLLASDLPTVKLGMLDVGGGLLWLAWDLVGARHPVFISAYIVAKAGREAYANREACLGFLASIKDKALSTYREASSALETIWDEFEAGFDAGYNEG